MYSHPEDYANLKKRVEEVYSEHEDEALEVRARNNDNYIDDYMYSMTLHIIPFYNALMNLLS